MSFLVVTSGSTGGGQDGSAAGTAGTNGSNGQNGAPGRDGALSTPVSLPAGWVDSPGVLGQTAFIAFSGPVALACTGCVDPSRAGLGRQLVSVTVRGR